MATYVTPLRTRQKELSANRHQQLRFGAVLSILLTLCAFAIQGYHPYAEDGGIYMAAVEYRINPLLFPHWTQFVLEPTRCSVFARFVAEAVRAAHVALPATLLLLYLSTTWLTLFAVWMLAVRCFETRLESIGAVSLFTFFLGVPIAGTALVIMDPYLTARSFSTPATILALVGILDWTSPDSDRRRQGRILCICALTVAFFMHPLMAAYALGGTLILAFLRSPKRTVTLWGPGIACGFALLLACILQRLAPPEGTAYARIALTRSYWFLSQWRWYEVAGLIAPMLILAISTRYTPQSRKRRCQSKEPLEALVPTGLWVGGAAILVSLICARSAATVHLVARLQPLRAFLVVYVVMTLLLGAALARYVLRQSPWRWSAAACLIGGIMSVAACSTFPDSPHFELHESASPNPWVQAFLWIRAHTAGDALFALDADYIHAPQEGAQCFRAIAQRSALADDSKDGGEASIAPDLTRLWTIAHNAQINLSSISDSERLARLRPLGVSWIVLKSDAATHLRCSYGNAAVKVCRLN